MSKIFNMIRYNIGHCIRGLSQAGLCRLNYRHCIERPHIAYTRMQQNVSRTVGSVFPHKKHAYMAKVLQVFLVAFILFVLTAAYLFLPEVYPFGVIRPSETCDVASIPNNTNMQLTKQYKIPIYPVTEETFTVLMLTSGKRMDLLRKSLRHFNTVPRIHKIVLCWNREDAVPPADLGDGLAVPMVTKIMKTHTLRMRFDAAELIETQGVLTIDDDLIFHSDDINLAFDVWRNHPYGLVGFHRRSHGPVAGGGYHYQLWFNLVLRGGAYSMILTGTSFIHKEYLRMYLDTLPPAIAKSVDTRMNCEDIAMNFLVQDHCKCAGVFFVMNRHRMNHMSESKGGGLSKKSNHDQTRSLCVTEFSEQYKQMPLQKVNCKY